MEAEAKRKISAASARSDTRKSKPNSSYSSSGIFIKFPVVFFIGFLAYVYQAAYPPTPKKLGPPDGLPITSPRIKLRDGRHLSYKEYGVPKESATYKIIYVHAFDAVKHDTVIATTASPALIEDLGIYIVSFDRPGYGESDPDPKRTLKSLALDTEEFADQLGLGSKFYVVGFSMGGQAVWSFLKYIPHRLAGATLIAPVVNFWWPNLPSNLTQKENSKLLLQDKWSLRVAHHLPWLTYWWNTQKWFPIQTVIARSPIFFLLKIENLCQISLLVELDLMYVCLEQARQQGEFESIHRDLNIGFGRWDFDPLNIDNPFPNHEACVHVWQGEEDVLVPPPLQRYIAQKLSWINYHELKGAGHMFPYADGISDSILKELLPRKN
ncbi:alpha/Beta hydrolase fold protein [Artemisia annua]|uniref:Alpha/Beta hydrolase fold protein n=1 Tax=Artemisia annua TaxID=35608 RepID=A0A2U1KQY4_ARTAN|nr:alpha/Beta hydrolase fold protein [Artemisia annua]